MTLTLCSFISNTSSYTNIPMETQFKVRLSPESGLHQLNKLIPKSKDSYLKNTTLTSKISNIIKCHSNNTSALDMSHWEFRRTKQHLQICQEFIYAGAYRWTHMAMNKIVQLMTKTSIYDKDMPIGCLIYVLSTFDLLFKWMSCMFDNLRINNQKIKSGNPVNTKHFSFVNWVLVNIIFCENSS